MTNEELLQIAEANSAERENLDHHVDVCMALGCMSQHSDKLKDALTGEVAKSGKRCHVRQTGCMGLCAAGPLVRVEPAGILYGDVHEADVKDIVDSLGGKPVERLETHVEKYFNGQRYVVLENSGHIDPEKIDEYIGRDGYQALMTARCVGACGRAPVSLEDGELVGLMEPAQLLKKLEGWAAK